MRNFAWVNDKFMTDVSISPRVTSKKLQKLISYSGEVVDHSTIRQKLHEITSMDRNHSKGNFNKDILPA